jgi:phenylacetyl-CoA:acceptor oxidoreductase 27-kDa subunit
MIRWGAVIDLEKCIGCKSCSIVCTETYGPESNWRTIYDLGIINDTSGIRLSVPVSCMHCIDAPCVEVCPTTASYFRNDGIVAIDYNKCVGCGYCVMACPYHVRTISHSGKVQYTGENNNHDASEISTKCTFCSAKIDSGSARGFKPGIDAEATPECVVTCSAHAITFGDMNNPDSKISRLIEKYSVVSINTDLGTQPSMFYIFPEKLLSV